MGRLRLLTFDLDNTLWEAESVIRAAERETREWLAERAPPVAQLNDEGRWPELRQAVLSARPELAHDVSMLRRAVLRRALGECGYAQREASRLAEQAFRIFLDARHRVELFEGALEVLDRLAARYRIGALTNGNADIRRLGLDAYFEFHFAAADVGASKPAPEIFRAALDHAGVKPLEAAHIGDHPEHDIQGAAQLGITTVWVNLAGETYPSDHVPPKMVVRRLQEIPQRLREHERIEDARSRRSTLPDR